MSFFFLKQHEVDIFMQSKYVLNEVKITFAFQSCYLAGNRASPVIGGSTSRPVVAVPAPYVPEELVSQAQVVLQGKSRNLIVRELQVSQHWRRSFGQIDFFLQNCSKFDI